MLDVAHDEQSSLGPQLTMNKPLEPKEIKIEPQEYNMLSLPPPEVHTRVQQSRTLRTSTTEQGVDKKIIIEPQEYNTRAEHT